MQGSGRQWIDPYPRLIKNDMDYNGDGYIDVEEAIQMYIPFATGSGIWGWTKDGFYVNQSSSVKCDQRPACIGVGKMCPGTPGGLCMSIGSTIRIMTGTIWSTSMIGVLLHILPEWRSEENQTELSPMGLQE
jgi:hypothetical protein